MNCITMFLKNRQRRKLTQQICDLESQSAYFLEKSNSDKKAADTIINYVELRQKQANNGDFSSCVYLSCYISEKLEEYQDFSESSAINYKHYKNLQNQINSLKKELSKFD